MTLNKASLFQLIQNSQFNTRVSVCVFPTPFWQACVCVGGGGGGLVPYIWCAILVSLL